MNGRKRAPIIAQDKMDNALMGCYFMQVKVHVWTST